MGDIRLTVEVDLIIEFDGPSIDYDDAKRVLDEMNYKFEDTTGLAKIDSEIVGYTFRS